MKSIKLGTLAVAAVIALGAYSTKAAIGISTNNSKLNVSLTVTTNTAQVVSGANWKNPVKTAKFGNKQLLDLFAGWDEADRTTEPWKSAKLVIGWDWSYDVLVVDKTGTNVLFNATTGYYNDYDYYFYVDFWDQYGVGNTSGKEASPGFQAVVDTGTAYFELYDNNYFLDYTDISCYGGNQQNFKQSWDSNGAYTTWSDSESAKFPYNGDNYFQDFGWNTTVAGSISANGKGKGSNYVGWWD
jgi:hypothetical protein